MLIFDKPQVLGLTFEQLIEILHFIIHNDLSRFFSIKNKANLYYQLAETQTLINFYFNTIIVFVTFLIVAF